MARRFVRANTEYLDLSSVPASPYGITMACWAETTSAATNQWPMAYGRSTDVTPFCGLNFNGLGVIRAGIRDDASTSGNSAGVSYSADTLYHVCGVFETSNRVCYIDGVADTPETTTLGAITLDQTAVGAVLRRPEDNKFSFDGNIAEAAIWNAVLDATNDIPALAAGFPPTAVRPDALVFYAPLVR